MDAIYPRYCLVGAIDIPIMLYESSVSGTAKNEITVSISHVKICPSELNLLVSPGVAPWAMCSIAIAPASLVPAASVDGKWYVKFT